MGHSAQTDRPSFEQVVKELSACSLHVDPFDPSEEESEESSGDEDEDDGTITDSLSGI
jgi:hypothetical protein